MCEQFGWKKVNLSKPVSLTYCDNYKMKYVILIFWVCALYVFVFMFMRRNSFIYFAFAFVYLCFVKFSIMLCNRPNFGNARLSNFWIPNTCSSGQLQSKMNRLVLKMSAYENLLVFHFQFESQKLRK